MSVQGEGERALSSSEPVPSFDIDNQLANTISNIGGNQAIYYSDRSRTARIGKVLAVLGLVLCLGGLALFVAVGAATAHNVLDALDSGATDTPYTQYLASGWSAAIGLVVGGCVVNRLARILSAR
jgi:beta-lactamase regulating signal transducer with metallopeptidase domain